jgi:hypothetical protein
MVLLTTNPTPPLPLPPGLSAGHLMVEPLPSFHAPPGGRLEELEKLWVVPDESERRAMTIVISGRLTPGLSAAIAASSAS